MKWIQGKPRDQLTLFTTCLDDMIDLDNEIRLIGVFVVDSLPLEEYGFNVHAVEDGRPRYCIYLDEELTPEVHFPGQSVPPFPAHSVPPFPTQSIPLK